MYLWGSRCFLHPSQREFTCDTGFLQAKLCVLAGGRGTEIPAVQQVHALTAACSVGGHLLCLSGAHGYFLRESPSKGP